MTYDTKTIGRYIELIEGSYHNNEGVSYTVNSQGEMIRVEKPKYQVKATRQSV